MVVDYIEVRKDHFSLFMEDDESFENYVDRMKWVQIANINSQDRSRLEHV